MKKLFTFLGCVMSTVYVSSQNLPEQKLNLTAELSNLDRLQNPSKASCSDKVLIFNKRSTGLTGDYFLGYDRGVGQKVPYNGNGTINSVGFYVGSENKFDGDDANGNSESNIELKISVFSTDPVTGEPEIELGSQNFQFSDNTNNVAIVNFTSSIAVNGTYIIVVQNKDARRIILWMNKDGEGAGENLAMIYAPDYAPSTPFFLYGMNKDFIVVPNVTHNIFATATASETSVSTGTTVTFTNNTTLDNAGYHNAYFYATNPATDLYVWDFNDGSPLEKTKNASHSFAKCGTYDVTLTANYVNAKDSTLCFDTRTFSITVRDDIQLVGTPSSPSVCGAADGAINISSPVVSGIGNLSWLGISSSAVNGVALPRDITGLVAGNYQITYTDAKNCIGQINVTVADLAPTINASSGSILCKGGNTSASISVLTGDISNYTFSWAFGGNTVATGNSVSSLTAGTYNINGTNGSCNTYTSITITEPPYGIEIASGLITHASSTTASDGGINITSQGGTGILTYAWANSTAPTTVIATTEDLNNVAIGTYILTITDANGCSVTASYTINVVAGINDLIIRDLNVYPNPTNDVVNIEASNIKEIQVLDLFGKLILTTNVNANSKTIELSQLANGSYFVKIITNDAQQVVKINLNK